MHEYLYRHTVPSGPFRTTLDDHPGRRWTSLKGQQTEPTPRRRENPHHVSETLADVLEELRQACLKSTTAGRITIGHDDEPSAGKAAHNQSSQA